MGDSLHAGEHLHIRRNQISIIVLYGHAYVLNFHIHATNDQGRLKSGITPEG